MARANANHVVAARKAAISRDTNCNTIFQGSGKSLWHGFRMPSEESNLAIATLHLSPGMKPLNRGEPDFILKAQLVSARIAMDGLRPYPPGHGN